MWIPQIAGISLTHDTAFTDQWLAREEKKQGLHLLSRLRRMPRRPGGPGRTVRDSHSRIQPLLRRPFADAVQTTPIGANPERSAAECAARSQNGERPVRGMRRSFRRGLGEGPKRAAHPPRWFAFQLNQSPAATEKTLASLRGSIGHGSADHERRVPPSPAKSRGRLAGPRHQSLA